MAGYPICPECRGEGLRFSSEPPRLSDIAFCARCGAELGRLSEIGDRLTEAAKQIIASERKARSKLH